MSVGERIQLARKHAGLTQKALAEKCGLATGTIQQYELDKRLPKNKEITQRIADALNVSAIYLLWGSEPANEWYQLSTTKESLAQDFETMLTSLKEILLENESAGIFSNDPEEDLLYYFWSLNKEGQDKALEQVELLTKIPEYQAKIEKSEEVIQKLDNDGNLTE